MSMYIYIWSERERERDLYMIIYVYPIILYSDVDISWYISKVKSNDHEDKIGDVTSNNMVHGVSKWGIPMYTLKMNIY